MLEFPPPEPVVRELLPQAAVAPNAAMSAMPTSTVRTALFGEERRNPKSMSACATPIRRGIKAPLNSARHGRSALEAEAAHAAKRECAERAGAGTGAVLVYASDSEEDLCGATEGTGAEAHDATTVSSCGEAGLCGDGDGASSDGEQTAEGEEEYDSEEL